ncbi:MAG: shikimate kinase AroK [Gammaproteobacteria bacterium]|nr:MAG: shikimate kinase AroK [Gammaproteobacteria bacterium]
MEKPRNVFVIGPMGAGKTTVGKLLAEALGLEFVDTDREIERRTGADIAWIFDVEGEEGFRRREAAMLDELTARQGVLVATGGGAVIDEENRKRLISRGTVIYLDAPLEQQVERTSHDRNRPLLQSGEPREVLERLRDERDPLYREVADHVFTADRRSAKVLAGEIARVLREGQD